MERIYYPEEECLEKLLVRFSNPRLDLGLKRIEKALKKLGKPCRDIPGIQIVGTNGKGSIASFLNSNFQITRIKAGITTSPHLISWCERIIFDGRQIDHEELQEVFKSVSLITKGIDLTTFEFLIASALYYFDRKEAEILVLEAGLGGRLDATTAHSFRPLIAMASIGLDHCEFLGNNLKEIAAEKAAVISPGSIVISAEQHSDVAEILEKTTMAIGAELKWVDPLPSDWDLGISGEIQRKNAAVARGTIQCLKTFGWEIEETEIRKAFAQARWPGRMQTIYWNQKPVLIDSAHNPHATEQLSVERKHWQEESSGITWIIGIQLHKEAPSMIRSLLKPNDLAWIIPIPDHESWDIERLAKACPEFSNQLHQGGNAEEVLSKLDITTNWPKHPPVIIGSIYLIGDLIASYSD